MKSTIFLTISVLWLSMVSCDSAEVKRVRGLKPVYGSLDDLAKMIQTIEAQPLQSPGKIYVKDQYLFVNEVLKGVHIYDNSDPSNPTEINFINIPGNLDVAMKGNYLYADYINGLATIDLSNINEAKLLDFDYEFRNEDNGQQYPPASSYSELNSDKIYFECPDASKGIVIGWDIEYIPQPQCYINSQFSRISWEGE